MDVLQSGDCMFAKKYHAFKQIHSHPKVTSADKTQLHVIYNASLLSMPVFCLPHYKTSRTHRLLLLSKQLPPSSAAVPTGKVLRTMVTPRDTAPNTRKDTTTLGWSELRDALADEVRFAGHKDYYSHTDDIHM